MHVNKYFQFKMGSGMDIFNSSPSHNPTEMATNLKKKIHDITENQKSP